MNRPTPGKWHRYRHGRLVMSRDRQSLVDISAELVHSTERAYLIRDRPEHEVWVAKAHVEWDGRTTFTMPEWLADDKDLA